MEQSILVTKFKGTMQYAMQHKKIYYYIFFQLIY